MENTASDFVEELNVIPRSRMIDLSENHLPIPSEEFVGGDLREFWVAWNKDGKTVRTHVWIRCIRKWSIIDYYAGLNPIHYAWQLTNHLNVKIID